MESKDRESLLLAIVPSNGELELKNARDWFSKFCEGLSFTPRWRQLSSMDKHSNAFTACWGVGIESIFPRNSMEGTALIENSLLGFTVE